MPVPSWSAPELTPEDLIASAALCRETLSPALERDWSEPAHDMEWSCQRTLDHLVNVMLYYSAHLATRATERLLPPRDGEPVTPPAQLLQLLQSTAAILADVVRAAPPDARGFHGAGMADGMGFLGMGCEEILMHTYDIASSLEIPFTAPEPLAAKVLARIFPWAPTNVSAWESLQWCSGRIALPDRERQDENWFWHCAPLSEWDGTMRRRERPPQWR